VSKRKLLLADDSITIQKVVNLTFADEGIEVISVGDGDSAMIKIGENAPDLILADVNMPGLNGYQICERIKQILKHRKFRSFCSSARSSRLTKVKPTASAPTII
jgi:CheY-like chemotaxis protein